MIWAMWYHYDSVHTYQINMGGKFKYLSKTAQRTVYLIISLYVLLGNNLQRYNAFTSNRKRPSIVLKINIVGAVSAASFSMQDNKFSYLVFVRVEKQRFRDANFFWERNDSDWSIFCCWITGQAYKEYK